MCECVSVVSAAATRGDAAVCAARMEGQPQQQQQQRRRSEADPPRIFVTPHGTQHTQARTAGGAHTQRACANRWHAHRREHGAHRRVRCWQGACCNSVRPAAHTWALLSLLHTPTAPHARTLTRACSTCACASGRQCPSVRAWRLQLCASIRSSFSLCALSPLLCRRGRASLRSSLLLSPPPPSHRRTH